MSIVLFAIIGATINAGTAYWVCFSVYCFIKLVLFVVSFVKGLVE